MHERTFFIHAKCLQKRDPEAFVLKETYQIASMPYTLKAVSCVREEPKKKSS